MTRLTKTVSRVTRGTLNFRYGPDRDKHLVISLRDGDLITLKPLRTSRPETISAFDLYNYLLRCRANREVLERAREKKARKAERLAAMRQKRAEKRLFEKE